MTDAFTIKNYTILTSLHERSVYMKVTDTVGFMCYEGTVDATGLRISIALADAYVIITNCFAEESGYSVNISVSTGNMKLKFNAIVGGFLKMEFDVFLKEKIMSNDGQLTLSFNRIEQKQELALQSLTKRCEELETRLETQRVQMDAEIGRLMNIINKLEIPIAPTHIWSCNSQKHFVANIETKTLEIHNTATTTFAPRSINTFYKLEKLVFLNFNGLTNLNDMSNKTIKEIEIRAHNQAQLTSLVGIENFPSLEILTVIAAPGLRDVVKTLTETKHKIKTLKFQSCAAINVVELQTYCQVNGAFLALS
jgi:hypothetical protein